MEGASVFGILTKAAVRSLVRLLLQLDGDGVEAVSGEAGLGDFSQNELWLCSII